MSGKRYRVTIRHEYEVTASDPDEAESLVELRAGDLVEKSTVVERVRRPDSARCDHAPEDKPEGAGLPCPDPLPAA